VTKTILVSFVALSSMAFAAGNISKVNLDHDSVIEGKTLKAGAYKLSMENGNAILRRGKESIEVPAKEENSSTKFGATELMYKDSTTLEEIDLGGTTTRIVFEGAAQAHSGE
jgi:uncharacterized protein with PhoU and TrkA domain